MNQHSRNEHGIGEESKASELSDDDPERRPDGTRYANTEDTWMWTPEYADQKAKKINPLRTDDEIIEQNIVTNHQGDDTIWVCTICSTNFISSAGDAKEMMIDHLKTHGIGEAKASEANISQVLKEYGVDMEEAQRIADGIGTNVQGLVDSGDDFYYYLQEYRAELASLMRDAEAEFANYTDKDYEKLGLRKNSKGDWYDPKETSESKASEYGYDDVMDSVDKNMGSDRYNKLKSMVDSMSSSSRQEFVKKTLSLSPDSNGVTQFEILRSLGFSEDELIGESKASETEDYWDYRDQGDPPDDWVNWYECKTCGKSGMDDGSDSMNTVGQHRRDNPTHRVEWSNATEESYSSEGRYMIRDKDGQWQVQELTDDLELAKAIADDSSTEEISGTQPDGAKGVVVDLDFRQVVYSAEVGSEDHGCVECGFTTADNSEYLDHLNSHEE